MAESPDKVIEFLQDLAAKSKPQAEKELAELKAFAKAEFAVDNLEAWDVGYYGEKLRQQRYAISQEELRPWFPAEKVIAGMFDVSIDSLALSLKPWITWIPGIRMSAFSTSPEKEK